MPAQITGRLTARRPAAAVKALPTANKIPAAAKARPICPERPRRRAAGPGRAGRKTPVLRPAVTTAAPAPMRSRFAAAGRSPRVCDR